MNAKARRKQKRQTHGANALSLSAAAIDPEQVGMQKAPAFDSDQEYILGYGLSFGYGTQRIPAEKFDPRSCVTFEMLGAMMNDPEVAADVRTLRDMVLSDGIELSPAYLDAIVGEESPEYARAVEIAEHCNRSMGGLRKSLKTTLESWIEDGLVYGNKTAEITWRPGEGLDAGRIVLARIACKDYRSLDIVLDAYSNHVGFCARSTGLSAASTRTIIPREKFLHLTINEKDEDPRGRSCVRPAFLAYDFKSSTWPEYYRWLQAAALPGLIGILPVNAKGDVQRNPDGTPKAGAKPNSAAETTAQALANIKNLGVAVLPNGMTVDQLESADDGHGFSDAIGTCDGQIGKAILRQTLATGEAQFGTRAQSQTHLDILDLVVWNLRGLVAQVLRADLIRQMVRYNFGEDAVAYMPLVSLGDSERRDWAQDATAAAAIAGELTDSQWNAITSQLGIPAPQPGEQSRSRAAAESMQPPATPAQDPAGIRDAPTGQAYGGRRPAAKTRGLSAPFVRVRGAIR